MRNFPFHFFTLCLLLLLALPAWAGDMTVTVYKSDGSTPLQGVSIKYLDGYWKSFGTTNGSGVAQTTIPDGVYDFRAEYGGTSVIRSFTVSGTSADVFYSSRVMVHTRTSSGAGLSGAGIAYLSGYWRNTGNTDGSGMQVLELFPGAFDFRASLNGTSATQTVAIPGDGSMSGEMVTVDFHTTRVDINVKQSDGSTPIEGVGAAFLSGYWRNLGNTNVSGVNSVELFPGTFDFRASLNGTSATQSVLLSGNGISSGSVTMATFHTTMVNIYAKQSDGSAFPGVGTAFESGYWRNLGNTDGSGLRTTHLFPATFDFRASIGGTSATQSAALSGNGVSSGASTDVIFYGTEVVFEVKDCDDTPISGVGCAYLSGYWRNAGNTNGSGERSINLFPGNLEFRASTGGTSEEKNESVPGDGKTAGQTVTVEFTPTKIDFSFSGSVKYLSGYWRNIGGVIYLFGGTYDFRFGDYATSLTVSGCELGGNVYIFKTLKHDGSPLPNIPIKRNDYGNHYVSEGTTDANGELFTSSVPDGSWKFRATKEYSDQYITSGPAILTFQASEFKAHVTKSDGSNFSGIEVEYNDYGNHWINLSPQYTDANGNSSIELFPGNFNFRAKKNYSVQESPLEINTSGTTGVVEFQTSEFVAHVTMHDGSDFPGIEVEYNDYGNHWIDLSPQYTDANGNSSIELFPGNFGFRAKKNYSVQEEALEIITSGTTGIVEFQTALAIGFVRDCENNKPVLGIEVEYNDYGNHWIDLSPQYTGADGKSSIELFPGTYDLRAKTIYTVQSQQIILQDPGISPTTTVEFNPTRVCFNFNGTVKYNDYGNHWINLPCDTYMFPGTYDFRFDSQEESIAISGCTFNQTLIVFTLLNSSGGPQASGNAQVNNGGWQQASGQTGANGKLYAFFNGNLTGNKQTRMTFMAGTPGFLSISNIQNVNLSTTSEVTYQLTDAHFMTWDGSSVVTQAEGGDPDAKVSINSGGWKEIGVLGPDGELHVDMFAQNHTVLCSDYNFTSINFSHNLNVDNQVKFPTRTDAIEVRDQNGLVMDSDGVGQVYINSGGWKSLGSTSNGVAPVALLKGTRNIRMDLNNTSRNANFNLNTGPAVFDALSQAIEVRNETNSLISNSDGVGTAYINSGGWQNLGNTSNGVVDITLLEGTWTLRMDLNYTSRNFNFNLASGPAVFDARTNAIEVQVEGGGNLQDADGVGTAYINSGGWQNLGNTSNGVVDITLLEGTWTLRMDLNYTSRNFNFNLASGPAVFDARVDAVELVDNSNNPLSGGDAYINSGGWQLLGTTDGTGFVPNKALLHGTWTFRMDYSSATKSKNINLASGPATFTWNGSVLSRPGTAGTGGFNGLSEDTREFHGEGTSGSGTVAGITDFGTFPNPVYSEATISFSLIEDEQVHLAIFDTKGNLVHTLHQGNLPAGKHQFQWDVNNRNAGTYVCRLINRDTVQNEIIIVAH